MIFQGMGTSMVRSTPLTVAVRRRWLAARTQLMMLSLPKEAYSRPEPEVLALSASAAVTWVPSGLISTAESYHGFVR